MSDLYSFSCFTFLFLSMSDLSSFSCTIFRFLCLFVSALSTGYLLFLFNSFSILSPLTLLSKFHIDADPDSTIHFDAYPNSAFLCSDPDRRFTLMRIQICLSYADPDPRQSAANLRHWPTDLHGSILSLHGFRVRLPGSTCEPLQLQRSLRGRCDADPPNVDADPDPAFHSNMRIRIQLFTFMLIRIMLITQICGS